MDISHSYGLDRTDCLHFQNLVRDTQEINKLHIHFHAQGC